MERNTTAGATRRGVCRRCGGAGTVPGHRGYPGTGAYRVPRPCPDCGEAEPVLTGTRQGGGRALAPGRWVLALTLPMPPTTNNLYSNVPKIGRVKSRRYEAWIEEAGRAPVAGQWRRLVAEDAPPRRCAPRPRWELDIALVGLPEGADVSNRIKAVEDLVCAMTGLEDRDVQRVTAYRFDTRSILGPAARRAGEAARWPRRLALVSVRIVDDEARD